MADYGLEISMEGHDILTPNLAPRYKAFSSRYDYPKIDSVQSASFTLDVVSPGVYTKTVTIPHGLSFIPQAIGGFSGTITGGLKNIIQIPFDIEYHLDDTLPATWTIMTGDISIDSTDVVLQFDATGAVVPDSRYVVYILNNAIEIS